MGGLFKSPKEPDPYQTAATESQFNRLDTYGPDGGGTRYGYTDPKTGQFVQGVAPVGAQSAVSATESPAQKAAREALTPASLDLINTMINQNFKGLPGPAQAKDTSAIAKTYYDRNTAMLMPDIERNNSRLLTNLQARGIPIGADAFNEAYGNQQKVTQDTLARVAQDATLTAGQEQSRQFGLDSAARGNALSEIAALMGGTYAAPNNAPSGAATGVNYSSAAQQGYENKVAQQKQNSEAMGSAGKLLGSMIMKCTAEAKDIIAGADTAFLSEVVETMPLLVWSYKPGQAPEGMGQEEHVGPMAEHFKAMTGLGDGKTINVVDAFGVLFGALQDTLLRLAVLERIINREEVH